MNRLQALCLTLASLVCGVASAASTTQDVSFINGQGITLTGKLYQPTTGTTPRPAVILMHGCSGFFSYSDKTKGIMSLYDDWAKALNNKGYVALVVNSFTPRNAPENQCSNGAAGTSEVTDRPYDSAAAAQYLSGLASVNPDKIGALGWSHGGSSVLAALDRADIPGNELLKVGVSFYPGCGLFGAFGGISTSTWTPDAPTLILHGDADALYTSGYCDARVNNAKALGANVKMTPYVGAQHSFDQAKQVSDKWTQWDVNAKQSEDPSAQLYLDAYLKN